MLVLVATAPIIITSTMLCAQEGHGDLTIGIEIRSDQPSERVRFEPQSR